MGLVNFGVPEPEVEFLKNGMGLDCFVEGGTFTGGTAKSMSNKFKKVYTIEKSEIMYEKAKDNLKDISNVTMLKGDTREHLKNIMENNDNILFWLDAHWSGGDTYGEEDECPLLEELKIIFEYDKNYVVLIDDARLFLAPPPAPHKIENWPSLTNILKTLPLDWELLELEDVIYLFPKTIDNEFKVFIQNITTERWKEYGKNNQVSFMRGIKIALLGLLKGKL